MFSFSVMETVTDSSLGQQMLCKLGILGLIPYPVDAKQ